MTFSRVISMCLLLVVSLEFALGSAFNTSSSNPSLADNLLEVSVGPTFRFISERSNFKDHPLIANFFAQPELLLKGIVALDPVTRLQVPAPLTSRAFSLSLCVFLTEDSTGQIRTLFSKGRNSNQRTPTLALLKNSRRLLIKVSTLFRPEISATSIRQLPLFQWTHVALTTDGYKTITLFVDGEEDQTLFTGQDVILANEGPFTLGKDHVFSGARALVSGLKVFHHKLAGEEIGKEAREALLRLPEFTSLARGELPLETDENIVEESEFKWRGEVAGSPPAVDTPPFVAPTSRGPEEEAADTELFKRLSPRYAFATLTREKFCQPQDTSLREVLLESTPERVCLEEDAHEPTAAEEMQRFWELLHSNRGEVSQAEVQNEERSESNPVDEFIWLVVQRVSPFRTVFSFVRRLLVALDVLSEWEDLQKDGGKALPEDAPFLEPPLETPVEPEYAGTPESEKGYRSRLAQEDFQSGKALTDAAVSMEPSKVRRESFRKGFRLLQRAADRGVGTAHLELAYLLAGRMNWFEEFERLDQDAEANLEDGATEKGASAEKQRHALSLLDEGTEPSKLPAATSASGEEQARSPSEEERVTYHFLRAATLGVREAFLALGYRSLHGYGIPACNESARFFFQSVAEVTAGAWQEPGDKVSVERSLLHGRLASRMKERSNLADLLQLMATSGHREANVALGNWYLWGAHGMPQDAARAARHFERAHRQGIPHGTVGLAKMLMVGDGVAKNASKALEYYEDAAKKGDREALNGLGYLAYNGLGRLERNLTQSYEYFKAAANLGSLDGLVNMGAMLRGGMGTPRDEVAAWGCFKQGALAGHVPSAHQAAMAASSGQGVERNPAMAANFFRVVAETGPWARSLQSGLSAFLEGNPRGALASYARAAELGYSSALYNSAWLLEKRFRDLGSTRKFARLAAAVYEERVVEEGGGNEEGARGVRADLRAWAHVRLGDCMYYGRGCGNRSHSAAQQYRASGSLGNGQGHFNLAYLLERGTHGVSRDLSEAEAFYRLSGEQPNRGAAIAAALALGKLRLVRFVEAYGIDVDLVWETLYGSTRSGWEAFCMWVQELMRSLEKLIKEGHFERRIAQENEANAPLTRIDHLEDDEASNRGLDTYAAFLDALVAASEEWVLLGLCVALGVTLGFKWMRQRTRHVGREEQ